MRRTGLSEFTLRAWERRHRAVTPARTDGRQRLYSEADIERLTLLAAIVAEGFAISTLAGLSNEELKRRAPEAALALQEAAASVRDAELQLSQLEPERDDHTLSHELGIGKRAVVSLNNDRLHQMLMRQMIERDPMSYLEDVLTPLLSWIGDEWGAGRLNEAQEHSASEILRRVLGFMLQVLRRERREHHVVVATMAGERHEFGAMMAAVVAAVNGWSYSYLGPDLPTAAIAGAVKQLDANVIAVSVITPKGAANAGRELAALRRALGKRRQIVVGGSSATVLDEELRAARATRVNSLSDWGAFLTRGSAAQ